MVNKKVIILVFILCLSVFVFASCNDGDSSQATTANFHGGQNTDLNGDDLREDVTEEIRDSLPSDLDFGGETLNLLIRSDVSLIEEFYAEEETGELFSDAIYRRNKAVEERLNMNLNIILGATWEQWIDTSQASVRRSILAGDKSYDLVADWAAPAPNLMLEGLYMDIKQLPHLDLSQPWWNKNLTEEAEVGGKLFFAAGDLTTTNLTSAVVFFFNKRVQQEHDLPDFYQTVIDGKWTNDYLFEITKNIATDLNGDGLMRWNAPPNSAYRKGGELRIPAEIVTNFTSENVTFVGPMVIAIADNFTWLGSQAMSFWTISNAQVVEAPTYYVYMAWTETNEYQLLYSLCDPYGRDKWRQNMVGSRNMLPRTEG